MTRSRARQVFLAGLFVSVSACAFNQQARARPAGAAATAAMDAPDLLPKILPAVVNIFARKPPDADTAQQSASAASPDDAQLSRFYASGFVIDPSCTLPNFLRT